MLFSSVVFLFLFLPLVLLLHSIVPSKYKNLILLISSIVFYTWGESELVVVMLFLIVVNYFSGRLIELGYKKTGLFCALFASLGTLIFYKYVNFLYGNYESLISIIGYNTSFSVPEILLPLGISFYTFQTLSYSIDVYKGNVKASKNFLSFATYVSLFPQLVAGPIIRYIDVEKQLTSRTIKIDNFAIGIERFIIGLAKKMIIANSFASIADQIFAIPLEDVTTGITWIGIISYSIQIYFDFSAYSDMAIGLGKMFGFDFLENFNYPYISKSIQEFWRRWHISLSSWFRDYVYIPLGGNRGSAMKTYVNLVIVFLATGLWHGASWNFIVWGLFHGFFIVVERIGFRRILCRIWVPFQHIYTLMVVIVSWVFFRAETLPNALIYLKKMFVISDGSLNTVYRADYYITKETIFMAGLALMFSLPLFPLFRKKLEHSLTLRFYKLYHVSYYVFLLVIFIITSSYFAVDTYNPFIYFRF